MTIVVHQDRYSRTAVVVRKSGVIVHDSESGDGSAAGLLAALTKPGDRLIAGSNPPRYYGSAYHAVTLNDAGANFEQVLGADCGPFHAPPLNKTHWGICMPGFAKQTAEEWQDAASEAGIIAVAKFIVEKSKLDGFPCVRITAAQLKAGAKGYCGHVDVRDAFGDTDHYDPGPGFPWDRLDAEIQKLLGTTPPTPVPPDEGDDDMSGFPTTCFRLEGTWDEFVRTAGDIQHGTTEEATVFRSEYGVTATPDIVKNYPTLVSNGKMALIIRDWRTHADGTPGANHAFALSVFHATGLNGADLATAGNPGNV